MLSEKNAWDDLRKRIETEVVSGLVISELPQNQKRAEHVGGTSIIMDCVAFLFIN